MFALLHSRGCGKAAFYYNVMPRAGATLYASKAKLLNGSLPKSGEKIICGSCDAELRPDDLKRSSIKEIKNDSSI